MDIMQQLEEVEKKIAEAPAEETSIIEEPAAPAPAEIEVEEPVTEEPEPEVTEETEEPKKTASDYAKERKTKREAEIEAENDRLKQEAMNAKAESAALRAIQSVQAKPEPEVQKAPDPAQDPDAYRDWMLEQQAKTLDTMQKKLQQFEVADIKKRALDELSSMEEAFTKTKPDYKEVMADAEERLGQFIRMQNPNKSEAEIKQMIIEDKLQGAAMAYKNGQNPVEAMYNRVKSLFRYEPKPKVEGKSEADKLAAVAKNKAKSASGIGSGPTTGTAHLTKEALLKMTPAEYAKLSDAERSMFLQ